MTLPKRRTRKPAHPVSVQALGLDVNNSFFVPYAQSHNVRALVYYHGKNSGKKFAVRTTTEDGLTGIRVWRVL